jgi:hypothetical protein
VAPLEMATLLDDNKTCDLSVWFHRPVHLENITFTELYANFIRTFIRPVPLDRTLIVNAPYTEKNGILETENIPFVLTIFTLLRAT